MELLTDWIPFVLILLSSALISAASQRCRNCCRLIAAKRTWTGLVSGRWWPECIKKGGADRDFRLPLCRTRVLPPPLFVAGVTGNIWKWGLGVWATGHFYWTATIDWVVLQSIRCQSGVWGVVSFNFITCSFIPYLPTILNELYCLHFSAIMKLTFSSWLLLENENRAMRA
jgi:hypothetical protein